MTKKFEESENTAVFTTRFVISDKKDITRVTHYREDGSWEFLSNDHFENYEEVVQVVSLGQIIKTDSTILELADMKKGYVAHRESRNDEWKIEEDKIH